MNSPKFLNFSKTLISLLFVASLILAPNLVRAQEPTEEEKQAKEYETYQKIAAEKDTAQKVDMAIKFLKESPKSTYKPNVISEYQKVILDLRKEQKWQEIISTCEKFVKVAPDDVFSITALAEAYSEAKNYKGFVAFAEKTYASNPNGEIAFEIAKAYKELGNEAKFMQWGEKTLASNPNNIDLLADLIRKASEQQNIALAVKYGKMCLKALPNAQKPHAVDAQKWKTYLDQLYATSYAVIGQSEHDHQNYIEAVKNLESAVKFFKNNDQAYLLLGDSYWRLNKIGPAELNFAKAYVIKGPASSSAKKQLDSLWSQTHKGSLEGLQIVIERARAELK
jgi:tetratricopeptide (TPR) repeat protein